jgi:16S rRNA (adenine1518-N6/adenine1519-N6)-dimethyltransferase
LSDDPLARQPGERAPWAVFKAELEALGFRPTKTLGQNFLVDPNAARSLAEDAGLGPDDRVLEVGAGCGFLTLHLAERVGSVLAVEIDERLHAVAARVLAGFPNVRLLHADALASKHELAPAVRALLPNGEPWHLVANLPYSISAPLLVVLARLPEPPRSMSVLVQEEVAERVAARPGEEAYGPLGVRLALTYEAELGRRVGAQLFWPRPRVASRVVALRRRVGPAPSALDIGAFDRLVTTTFQQRRKQLGTSLAGVLEGRERVEAWLGAAGIDPRARVEELPTDALLRLSRSPEWRAHAASNFSGAPAPDAD